MKLLRLLILVLCLLGVAGLIPPAAAQSPCGDSYVVLPGDTLSEIAEICNTTVEAILQANPQITNPGRITPGQRLKISLKTEEPLPAVTISPTCGPPGTNVSVELTHFPENALVNINLGRVDTAMEAVEQIRLNEAGTLKTEITIPFLARPQQFWVVVAQTRVSGDTIEATSDLFSVTRQGESTAATTYFVQPGDSIRGIAARYELTTNEILAVNPQIVDPRLIFPGQTITIPAPVKGLPDAIISPSCGSPGTEIRLAASNFPDLVLVEVRVGKWLGALDIVQTARSDPGGAFESYLTIPYSAKSDELWVVTVQTSGTPIIKATSNAFSVIQPVGPAPPQSYTVQPGETLGEIAARFNTTIAAILAANPGLNNSNVITVGQTLIIPRRTETVSLTPDTGPPSTAIQVEASNFPARIQVEVAIGRPGSDFQTVATAATDVNGRLRTQVIIPASARPNQRWLIRVRTVPRGPKFEAISEPFVVIGTQPTQQAVVTIWPLSGPPGSSVDVVAAGFPAYKQVQIGLGLVEAEAAISGTAWTDINGTFYFRVTIPKTAATNEEWGVVVTTLADPFVEARSPIFTITR